ncbi:MAG TPA: DMT family transporter [Verrucomicrobiae bacterium]|jgi:drug/metabolite transporter (DMT)-like permease|nr:DMT family transporter [Verrucomicrobiae bacterium]
MAAALLAALLFSISAICGYRSSKQIGGAEANFWRISIAAFCLALWAHILGGGLSGVAFPLFVVSGFFGIGLGDTGYFQALPRLGSRRAVLLTQCFIPLFAILIEWLWLGTKLTGVQLFCIAIILTGIALAPSDHAEILPRQLWIGIAFTIFAGLCSAFGAVLSRKAYFVAHAAGEFPDPGTTGYQRVLGGLLIPAIILIVAKSHSAHVHGGIFEEKTFHVSREKWRRIWPWVLGNSLAGQTLGVTYVQWALEKIPTGIVMAVVATTPIVLLPMTRIVEKEKIGIRSLVGAIIAVAGVIGLTYFTSRHEH